MDQYNEDKKRDEGNPVIGKPGASFRKSSVFGKTSSFPKTSGGIMQRLKNLSKKDIAFVLAGIAVLIMVPVAEYLMSKPGGAGQLTPGFGQRSEGSGSVYEPGINSLSQGSPDGSGEVITPLSSRDPASLIIGAQQPQPLTPPPASLPPKTDFRDAMKESARAAMSAASRSAGAPTVIPKMQSALRGMGSFFSGGEGTRTTASLSGNKILADARNASGKAASRSMVGPVATAGYKGVASNVPNSSSRDAYEKLRGQAGKAAGNFNGESAIRSLDKAAADSLDLGRGAGGAGGGSEGEKYKSPSGSSIHNSHNNSGESLEQMAAKMRMQKALDWEFFKKYEIPKQIINAALSGFTGVLTDFVKGTMEDLLGLTPASKKCWVPMVCPDSLCREYIDEARAHGATGEAIKKYVCEIGSAVPVTTKVGKESSSSTKEICMCGTGADPTYGGGSGGTVVPVSSSTVSGVRANTGYLSDYDAILLQMVLDTDEAGRVPDKAEENARKVAGGFKELGRNVNGPVKNVLANSRKEAGTELAGWSDKINAAQAKFDGVKPGYDKFVSQIAVLEQDLAVGKVRMRRSKTAKGAEGVLTTEMKTSMLASIKTWNNFGVGHYVNASGELERQHRLYREYSSQLPLVDKGLESILAVQASVDKTAASIDSDGGSGIEKLKKMTGRTDDDFQQNSETETADAPNSDSGNALGVDARDAVGEANAAPLKTTAEQLRGLDWNILWEREHSFNDYTAVREETSAWKEWEGAVKDGKPGKEAVPDSFLSNEMRSNEITAAVKAMLPGLQGVEEDLNFTKTAMLEAKTALMNSGASGSYFDSADAEAPAQAVQQAEPKPKAKPKTKPKPKPVTHAKPKSVLCPPGSTPAAILNSLQGTLNVRNKAISDARLMLDQADINDKDQRRAYLDDLIKQCAAWRESVDIKYRKSLDQCFK
ncbi:MAG: hypothetical protein WCW52_10645 [Elusimicrobiales bacterium]|jgi:hypothetical protein